MYIYIYTYTCKFIYTHLHTYKYHAQTSRTSTRHCASDNSYPTATAAVLRQADYRQRTTSLRHPRRSADARARHKTLSANPVFEYTPMQCLRLRSVNRES